MDFVKLLSTQDEQSLPHCLWNLDASSSMRVFAKVEEVREQKLFRRSERVCFVE